MGYPVDDNVVVSYHQASRITIGSTCGIKWLCDRGQSWMDTILVTLLLISSQAKHGISGHMHSLESF